MRPVAAVLLEQHAQPHLLPPVYHLQRTAESSVQKPHTQQKATGGIRTLDPAENLESGEYLASLDSWKEDLGASWKEDLGARLTSSMLSTRDSRA